MRIRLTRKLAECIDGVDLSRYAVGDVLELTPRDAQLLTAEQWAVPVRRRSERRSFSVPLPQSQAADRARRVDDVERVRSASAELEHRHLARSESRRAEDQYREERRAARERTVSQKPLDAR